MKVLINYHHLRKINPEAARTAVLEFMSSNENISECARAFGINRNVIYDILKRKGEDNLKDKSRAPKKIANKTPREIVESIRYFKQTTHLGPRRLTKYLKQYHNITIAYGTLRGILERGQ